MHFFYTPDISSSNELPENEAQHCIRVLRLKEGDTIKLTDGRGFFYNAIITLESPRHCMVDVIETLAQPLHWKNRIEIAVAPTKNMDRMEWFAEKATEAGINKVSFLNCRFSERKDLKASRIEKILISAMKQSMQATLPSIQEITDFKKFITQDFPGQKLIAHCYPGQKSLLCQTYLPGEDVLILIGPEGDFSEEEVQEAIKEGFLPVSLGENRLRTETAALYACQTIHIINQLNS